MSWLIAPSTVEQTPGYRVKTDRLDAAKMARDREQGRLKGVRIPTRVQHEHRQLSRTYAQAVKDKSRAQRRIRSLMQEQGRIGPAPSGWQRRNRPVVSPLLPTPPLREEIAFFLHQGGLEAVLE